MKEMKPALAGESMAWAMDQWMLTLLLCLSDRKHSLICSALVAGLMGNELCSTEKGKVHKRKKGDTSTELQHIDNWTGSDKITTFFSSTTGWAGFTVTGSSGGNPSLRLLSACMLLKSFLRNWKFDTQPYDLTAPKKCWFMCSSYYNLLYLTKIFAQ